MAALSAGALAPLAGLSPPLPWCSPSPLYCRRSPPLLKVAIAKTRPGPAVHQFAPASLRKCAAMSEHGRQEVLTNEYQLDDDEPLWLAVVRDLVVGLKGLVAFLAEQPRQLKHLEWPGFQHTMKTATLTLVLVAVFIVALSTIDAALCYMLAWLLRKSA
ncbi:hypothetical protein BDA96_02G232000 [Sorghum bicolor]|uniref:Uncharacterized protein n=1 Tax=Sorghum bicolor TaxID=4558 RepID=A0A921RRU5_SORBI|nr:hypothetical protein BDA96_02G232000 [Sorghum bicolor]KAG0543938.1 hypothetical protein BDA96_02G232000 [Sorghum bicolor]